MLPVAPVAANGDQLGHCVNVAARLQAVTEPGTMLLREPPRTREKIYPTPRKLADNAFTPRMGGSRS